MSTPATQVEAASTAIATSTIAPRTRQLVAALVWLSLSVAVSYAVVGWWAASHGRTALAAVGVAAVVCWFASTLALFVSAVGQNTPSAVPCLLLGTLIRLFVPGIVGVVSDAQHGPLAQAGLLGYIVVFFLITLTIETGLLVWLLRSAPPSTRPPSLKVS